MTRIDGETKRKLREMRATSLVDAFKTQNDTLTLGSVLAKQVCQHWYRTHYIRMYASSPSW